MSTIRRKDEARKAVRETYGEIARGKRVGCGPAPESGKSSCCGSETTCESPSSTGLGYDAEELAALPEGADLGLGCGNPGALASLSPGDVVLDLGSGGGIDCFLAAREVGETGRVIGVDMTADMVERARANAEQAGVTNVEFRLGEIEHLPVADGSVDVILSNCVINLSTDKAQVYREAFRVLKPGGRISISDIVAKRELSPTIRENMALYAGCVAGAATVAEYERWIEEAGFHDVRIQGSASEPSPEEPDRIEHHVFSATIEATKPIHG